MRFVCREEEVEKEGEGEKEGEEEEGEEGEKELYPVVRREERPVVPRTPHDPRHPDAHGNNESFRSSSLLRLNNNFSL